jgi:putative hydrolase of the HAD superfamily
MTITHIFFDIGGVLGTNGWDFNNESAELNAHRLQRFGLIDLFSTFFSSCWLGVTKPARRIYELALLMSQAEPECSVFIDDREQNLPPARALGMRAIRYTSACRLTADLATLGIAVERRGDLSCNSR